MNRGVSSKSVKKSKRKSNRCFWQATKLCQCEICESRRRKNGALPIPFKKRKAA